MGDRSEAFALDASADRRKTRALTPGSPTPDPSRRGEWNAPRLLGLLEPKVDVSRARNFRLPLNADMPPR